MSIYARFGLKAVKVLRYATQQDVEKLDPPFDAEAKKNLANKSWVVIQFEDGKERISHLAYLRADGAIHEIMEALRATDSRFTRERGPSNFELIEILEGGKEQQSHGIFDTLDEARGAVAFDKVTWYEIWQGDTIVEESDPPAPPKVTTFENKPGVTYPRTWWDVAIERGAKVGPDGSMSGGELERVGISILNGCPDCGACVAPYNSYQLNEANPYAYCRGCAGVPDQPDEAVSAEAPQS